MSYRPSFKPKKPACLRCFMCGAYTWTVTRALQWSNVELCLPCYVDVLEERQEKGASAVPVVEKLREGPDQQVRPLRFGEQMDLFD